MQPVIVDQCLQVPGHRVGPELDGHQFHLGLRQRAHETVCTMPFHPVELTRRFGSRLPRGLDPVAEMPPHPLQRGTGVHRHRGAVTVGPETAVEIQRDHVCGARAVLLEQLRQGTIRPGRFPSTVRETIGVDVLASHQSGHQCWQTVLVLVVKQHAHGVLCVTDFPTWCKRAMYVLVTVVAGQRLIEIHEIPAQVDVVFRHAPAVSRAPRVDCVHQQDRGVLRQRGQCARLQQAGLAGRPAQQFGTMHAR